MTVEKVIESLRFMAKARREFHGMTLSLEIRPEFADTLTEIADLLENDFFTRDELYMMFSAVSVTNGSVHNPLCDKINRIQRRILEL